ncbi:GTPase family protein [Fusobacterium polymorphum]|uniref:GTPase family protein n=1 Tax=Fusobacterium nucleatum subsp. polymorphum TaxID=76857 RepID=UPI0030CB418F
MRDKKSIFEEMENDIMKSNVPEKEKSKLLKNLFHLKEQKINLMITGATGCGKSSTINALFDLDIAKVGTGVNPETMEITRYDLDNLILWDSPGLGDNKDADRRHTRGIISKLNEKDEKGNLLVDLILVILEGSSKDLGTSYDLINEVIIPNLGEDKKNRILVAINQADVAMKGRYWNYKENKPEPKLVEFLEEKVKSVSKRIKEATGLDITPIYYSAGFKEDGIKQNPYNLSKLLYYIIKHTPKEKRASYAQNINQNAEMWTDSDGLKNYKKGIFDELSDAISEGISDGIYYGGEIGSLLGKPGEVVGKAVGAAVGSVCGFLGGVWNSIFD